MVIQGRSSWLWVGDSCRGGDKRSDPDGDWAGNVGVVAAIRQAMWGGESSGGCKDSA